MASAIIERRRKLRKLEAARDREQEKIETAKISLAKIRSELKRVRK